MQIDNGSRLYIQSPKLNQLNILKEVAADAHITQAELAGRCSLSVAMVNNYMKELCRIGYMEYHRRTIKSVTYHLTPLGTKQLGALQAELIGDMVDLFSAAKSRIQDCILSQCPSKLAQLVFHSFEVTGARILGICDDNIETIGSDFCGREVLNSSQIRFLAPDAVIIADMQRTEEIYQSLQHLSSNGIQIIRLNAQIETETKENRNIIPMLKADLIDRHDAPDSERATSVKLP
jgi:predicted transcriptional regulator